HVRLERQRVAALQLLAVRDEQQLAAVRRLAEAKRSRARLERDRRAELLARDDQVGADVDRAGSKRDLLPLGIDGLPARVGIERNVRTALGEQHADRRARLDGDSRALVVVTEDLAVVPAVLRVAVRTPLRHSDSVPPTVAGE